VVRLVRDVPEHSMLLVGEWYVPTQQSLPLNKMKFYYVYILKSLNHDFIYTGFSEDLKRRFKQHNNKEELSTKYYGPFDLIFYEAYRNIKDAKRREEYFKTTKGKTTLKLMLKEYFK
jgi:putative endonuclease